MVFWGVKIKPKRPYFLRTEQYEGQRLHISQATLGLNGKPNERSIVKCKVGDGPGVFICSLNTGVVDSCTLDLYFEEDVIFSVSGSAPVYLSGYYMDLDEPEEDTEDESSDEDYMGVDDDFIVDDDLEEDDYVDDESEDEGIARPSSVKIVEVTDDEQVKMEQKLITTPSRDAKTDQEESEDDDGFAVPSKRKGTTNEADKLSKKKKTSDDTQATPAENQSKKKKKKKKQKKTPQKNENDGADVQMKDVLANGKENGAAGNLVEGKQEAPGKNGNSSKKGSASKKFPNGLEIGELSMGKPDGKQAKPGKKVVIHYIGKLKSNGKIFDSTVGKKPFQFRLGINEVVKGFDIGVTGMRVGDKRRITIPPAMGYGTKALGEIPPNSWLVFDIELVDVKG